MLFTSTVATFLTTCCYLRCQTALYRESNKMLAFLGNKEH